MTKDFTEEELKLITAVCHVSQLSDMSTEHICSLMLFLFTDVLYDVCETTGQADNVLAGSLQNVMQTNGSRYDFISKH